MDSSLAISRISTPTISVRTEPPAAHAPVPTELGAAKSVTASANSAATVAYDPALIIPEKPKTARGVVVDPKTREVIYREISQRSGEVLSQVPGDAMLKLLAYYRDIAHPDTDRATVEKTS